MIAFGMTVPWVIDYETITFYEQAGDPPQLIVEAVILYHKDGGITAYTSVWMGCVHYGHGTITNYRREYSKKSTVAMDKQ